MQFTIPTLGNSEFIVNTWFHFYWFWCTFLIGSCMYHGTWTRYKTYKQKDSWMKFLLQYSTVPSQWEFVIDIKLFMTNIINLCWFFSFNDLCKHKLHFNQLDCLFSLNRCSVCWLQIWAHCVQGDCKKHNERSGTCSYKEHLGTMKITLLQVYQVSTG